MIKLLNCIKKNSKDFHIDVHLNFLLIKESLKKGLPKNIKQYKCLINN